MTRSQKLLIASGLALAIWGMAYGLYYALFDEHQTLDRMGASLATSFARAAERKMPEARAALQAYAETKFEYVREVDVHSHWIGLAMLLIVLGVVFDHLAFEERHRVVVALGLVVGSIVFPLGVILQTVSRGLGPQALAVIGSALVILSLAVITLGLARRGAR